MQKEAASELKGNSLAWSFVLAHPCTARVPVGMHFCHLSRWEERLPVPQWSPAELSPSLPRTILLVLAPASPTTLLHHPLRKRGRPFLNVQGPSSWTRQERGISPEGTRGAEARADRTACVSRGLQVWPPWS